MAQKKRKRAPINQLREVNKFAEEFLVSRGIRRPESQSVIKTILSTPGAPALPGIPPYLPTPWAINNTKRILLNIGKEWALKNKQDNTNAINLDAFIKFVFKVIKQEDFEIEKEIFSYGDTIQKSVAQNLDTTQQTVADWLRPVIKKEALKAITMFVLDSVAVCLATKAAGDVPSFYEWFDDWCEKLKMYWPQNLRNIDGKNQVQTKPS